MLKKKGNLRYLIKDINNLQTVTLTLAYITLSQGHDTQF